MRSKLTRSPALLAIPAILLLVLTGCGGSSSENQSAGKVSGTLAANSAATDLTGTWKLNKDLSDPPPQRPALDSLRQHRGQRPDTLRGDCPWPPPDSLRHRFGRHGRHPFGDSLRPPFCDSLRPPMGDSLRPRGEFTMTIAQTDSTVTMTGPFGREHTLYTDGRTMTPEGPRAPEGATVSAMWNAEGELVIAHTGPRGGTRTETFSLADGGAHLVVVSVMTRPEGGETKSFRRVFDAVSSGS